MYCTSSEHVAFAILCCRISPFFRFRITRCHSDKNRAYLSIKYFWEFIEKIETRRIRIYRRLFKCTDLFTECFASLIVCIFLCACLFPFRSNAFFERQWTLRDSFYKLRPALCIEQLRTIFRHKNRHVRRPVSKIQ